MDEEKILQARRDWYADPYLKKLIDRELAEGRLFCEDESWCTKVATRRTADGGYYCEEHGP